MPKRSFIHRGLLEVFYEKAPQIEVINICKKELQKHDYRDLEHWLENPNHIYIGRNLTFYVKGAIHSKWANPFSVKKYNRDECLQLYKEWIKTGINPITKKKRKEGPLHQDIDELKGKKLGCWCHPEACHGDVLAQLLSDQFITYVGNRDITDPIERLIKVGATTIPIIPEAKLKKVRKTFRKTCRKFPEYKRPSKNTVYVLGGFAALGNPASFHNPFVRSMREEARQILVQKLFKPLLHMNPDDKLKLRLKLEVLIDRMMWRHQGQQPSAETWHRDEANKNLVAPNDLICGGWINFDSENQYCSFIPGSHLGIDPKTLSGGFANPVQDLESKLSKYNKELKKKKSEKIKAKIKEVKAKIKEVLNIFKLKKYRITIPPGHAVIFPQYILHEVVNTLADHDMFRLFTGYRLTTSSTPLFPNTMEALDNQGIIRLGGGMQPPMYSRNHGSSFLRKAFYLIGSKNKKYGKDGSKFEMKESTIDWSNHTFKDRCLIERYASTDKQYKIVKRFMNSLREYDPKWMYKPYSEEEKSIYRPLAIQDIPSSQVSSSSPPSSPPSSPAQVIYFYGHSRSKKYKEFSQFFKSPFVKDGVQYLWAEQWMMSNKARLMGDDHSLKLILAAQKPSEVKKLGRKVKPWDNKLWNTHKYNIVLEGTRLKVAQNPDIKRILLETGDAIIAEAAANDRIWGIGLNIVKARAGKAWRGQNLLGKALMQVRDEISEDVISEDVLSEGVLSEDVISEGVLSKDVISEDVDVIIQNLRLRKGPRKLQKLALRRLGLDDKGVKIKPVKGTIKIAQSILSTFNVQITGARAEDILIGASVGSKGAIIKIYYGNVYPEQRKLDILRQFPAIWKQFLIKLGGIPFFNKMTKEEREEWLFIHEDPYHNEITIGQGDVKIEVLQPGAFVDKLSSQQIDELMMGKKSASEIEDMFPHKPGSKARKHTLALIRGFWKISTNYEVVDTFAGTVIDLPFQSAPSHPIIYILKDITAKLERQKQKWVRIIGKSGTQSVGVRVENRAYPLQPTDMHGKMINLSPSFYKSFIQKIIRFRPLKITFPHYLSGPNELPSSDVLSQLIIAFMQQPGSFVPDIKRYVTGLESTFKRLGVCIFEDAHGDANAVTSLFTAAFISPTC